MGLCNISIALFFCFESIIFLISLNLKNKKLLILVLVILITFIYSRGIRVRYNNIFNYSEDFYILRIESLKEEVKNYNKYIARVKSGKYNNFKIYIYSKQEFEFGTIIQCSDEIEKPDGMRNDKRF